MRRRALCVVPLTFIIVAGIASSGCTSDEQPKSEVAATADNSKIPITTSSEEARKEFQTGRDLSEKLLTAESLAHFDKAIAADPNFALAHLSRATSSPIGKEFFAHLGRAVQLAPQASNGERLLILATEAGANGNAVKQKDYLDQLVAAHPGDERAHFNLGGYHFAQQEYSQAIEHYRKAAELNPTYSPVFNILGYAYRQTGDYANAEQAFRKYIELIPNDPNPYDSYGELLLKMGKFDESIAQYQKALSIDRNFTASNAGIAANLLYQGKAADAAAEAQKIMDKARNDFERRTSLFTLTVVHADSGQLNEALGDVDKLYALAEKTNDVGAMAGDLQTKANILVEMGRYDDALELFEQAVKITDASNLSQEIKDNAKLGHHQNLAIVALGKKDMATARAEAEAFQKGTEASMNPAQIRQAHGLNGRIALQAKEYDTAISELQQANQQDPYDLYRLCLAYDAKGEKEKARESCTKAADFNSIPQFNYALVRAKAKKMAYTPS